MNWKEKLWGASIIYEVLFVLPCTVVVYNAIKVWQESIVISEGLSWTWAGAAFTFVILTGWYCFGLLLAMGLIEFARRRED